MIVAFTGHRPDKLSGWGGPAAIAKRAKIEWRRPIAFWTLPEGLGDPTSIYPRPGWWRRHREDVRGVLRFSVGAALGAGAGFGWWLSRFWP